MPNRILKESICTSENLDKLSPFQEVCFYRLLVNCDDYGRFDARPKILAARLFPLKDIRTSQIEDALRALTSAELVTLYEVDGKPFLQMNTWTRHQQIRNSKSKYPSPEESNCNQLKSIDINCNQLQSNDINCTRNPIQSNPNPNPIRNNVQAANRFAPPTVDEVRAYCQERKNNVDPQKWHDFYSAKGWKIGANTMKDWKAAVRTWEKKDDTPQAPQKQVVAQQYHQRSYTEDQLTSRAANDLLREAEEAQRREDERQKLYDAIDAGVF